MFVSNISEDVGRNNELKNNGKTPYEFRDYQKNSINNYLAEQRFFHLLYIQNMQKLVYYV